MQRVSKGPNPPPQRGNSDTQLFSNANEPAKSSQITLEPAGLSPTPPVASSVSYTTVNQPKPWGETLSKELKSGYGMNLIATMVLFLAFMVAAAHPLGFAAVGLLYLALGLIAIRQAEALGLDSECPKEGFSWFAVGTILVLIPPAIYLAGAHQPSWLLSLPCIALVAQSAPQEQRAIPVFAIALTAVLSFWMAGATLGQLIPVVCTMAACGVLNARGTLASEHFQTIRSNAVQDMAKLNRELQAANIRSRDYAQGLEVANQKAELTMQQLQRARDEAEAAGQSKADFLANMSHEIRTPLNGVMGMLELLKLDAELGDEQMDYIGIALNSANDLLAIINGILDFSKIEAGRLEIESVAFNLGQKIENTGKLLVAGLPTKEGVDFKIQIDNDIPAELWGDPTRVNQIIVNFLSNAFKFTQLGEITLRAKNLGLSNHHCMVELSITDTGIGIPSDRLPVIFDKFTQADSSTTRQYGGTGLGLAICKQLALLMDGEVGARSQIGQGSTFWLRIPFKLSQQGPPPDAPLMPALTADKTPIPHVLIVEDNLINQLVTKRFIHRLGWHVEVCADGRSALQKLRNHLFDVVLLDCQMPVMSGYETAKRIRGVQSPNKAPIKIIGLTTSTMKSDHAKCKEAGMDAVLKKPLEFNALQTILTPMVALPPAPIAPSRDPRLATQALPHGARKIKGTSS